jgi:hypothetical protein
MTPLTDGKQGLELVRILEASSRSLKLGGSAVDLSIPERDNDWMPPIPERLGAYQLVEAQTNGFHAQPAGSRV